MSYNIIFWGDVMKIRIRDLREDNDLTQRQIADFLLCDQSLYSKYERGEREIPLKIIVRLAEYYNVSVDYILGLTSEKSPFKKE